jgi:hypothetical protein
MAGASPFLSVYREAFGLASDRVWNRDFHRCVFGRSGGRELVRERALKDAA